MPNQALLTTNQALIDGVLTSAVGSPFVPLNAATCDCVDIVNDTGQPIEYIRNGQSPIQPPVQAAAATAGTGGTLAAATYFYVVTAIGPAGESFKSNEQSVAATGATSSNTISWSAVPGATGYRVYRGTAAGAESVYYAVGAVTTFLDTGAANTVGTPPSAKSITIPTGTSRWIASIKNANQISVRRTDLAVTPVLVKYEIHAVM